MTATFEQITLNPPIAPKACVIWLHGLGADGHDFAPLVPQLPKTLTAMTRFIFPHAPIQSVTVNAGFPMRAWFDILEIAVDAPEDHSGILTANRTLNTLIETQIDSGIPSTQIILAGFSQGGALALHCGLRYPKPLGGILGLSTYLPRGATLAQEAQDENRNTPIFLAHGQYDPLLPIQFAEITHQTLRAHHYSVQWQTYPMEHAVCPEELQAIGDFLQKQLCTE